MTVIALVSVAARLPRRIDSHAILNTSLTVQRSERLPIGAGDTLRWTIAPLHAAHPIGWLHTMVGTLTH
jgi:hypothetical protein